MREPASIGHAGRPGVRGALGVAVPLMVVTLAYTLWWISDHLLYIGPLDRAAFGWAVVIPVWLAAPVAAGFAWRPLGERRTFLAAGVVGSIVGVAAAVLSWQAFSSPDCEYGAIRTPGEWVPPALILGAVIGGGLAGSGLLAWRVARDGALWRAAIFGVIAQAITVATAVVVAGSMLLVPACQRPQG